MARFRAAAVFSDHMVLQRDKNIAVFGEGEDGERVTVTIWGPDTDAALIMAAAHGQDADAALVMATAHGTVRGGRWQVMLPPQKAGCGYSMTVACGEYERRFTDIAVGEVWLAGGQSNMELELQNSHEGAQALSDDGAMHEGKGPNVRFYYTQKMSYQDDAFFEQEAKSGWCCFGGGNTGAWSAVGYFFARKLAGELGVTVGVIGCNWGGTSASAWMDRDSLMEDTGLRSYVDEYEAAVAGKSVQEQIREYDEYEAYHAVWSKKAEELAKTDPMLAWDEVIARCGECKWPGPMGCKSPFRPSGLYQCMLERIIPYTMRGVIWYQGESDDHKPRMYEKLFTRLIGVWRRKWKDLSMPFLFVQLPMHRYQQDADFKNWPLIREAQANVYRTVKNTGMAVITDFSEWNEIHPKRKQQAGERLARQAMFHVYHALPARDAFGPMYRDKIVHPAAEGEKTGRIELMFDYAEDGFLVSTEPSARQGCPADAPDLTEAEKRSLGFEIAGEDRRFVPAEHEICGSRIFVYADAVADPQYVRYLWTNYRIPYIFGARTRIPLAPFRTDPDDEATAE